MSSNWFLYGFNWISNYFGYELAPVYLPTPLEERAELGKVEQVYLEEEDYSAVSERVLYLVIHCTAGNPNTTAGELQEFFTRSKEAGGRGWRRGGYHLVVEKIGQIIRLYHDREYTNGVLPFRDGKKTISNRNTVHICYTGGVSMKTLEAEDTRTQEQKEALAELVFYYIEQYPHIQILGHRDIANKACPSFDVQQWLITLGIDEKNIWRKN